MGRPKLAEPRRKQLNVSVTAREYARLSALADERGVTRSDLVYPHVQALLEGQRSHLRLAEAPTDDGLAVRLLGALLTGLHPDRADDLATRVLDAVRGAR